MTITADTNGIEQQGDEFTYHGFSEQQLQAAFNAVKDRRDWKAPIMATITRQHVELVYRAIVFYTATEPTFTHLSGEVYRVEAMGYRNGPAA
jgi:hypothetical protein